ncbi:hypothetical protein Taro_034043 [Colocasia esculenta]|uniref:Uncharacterized protein n=1 Tax=Colocasia esculenta TaxID=4460 RepID=A0A843VWS2_COLES|nr:hypothetical protein [Colocasia esculenta]
MATTARAEGLALVVLLMTMLSAGGGEWVDYPSGIRCCSDIPVETCDPWSPDANAACRDVCHYGGCRKGGQCEEGALGFGGRFCHCNC